MRDIILLIYLIIMAVFGYFLMRRLDNFLDKNRKTIQNQRVDRITPHIVLKNGTKNTKFWNEADTFHIYHSDVDNASGDFENHITLKELHNA